MHQLCLPALNTGSKIVHLFEGVLGRWFPGVAFDSVAACPCCLASVASCDLDDFPAIPPDSFFQVKINKIQNINFFFMLVSLMEMFLLTLLM